jgi:putative aldouronate transport system permease protein
MTLPVTLRRPPGAPAARPAAPESVHRRRPWRRALRRDWQLYSLAILPLLFFVVFRYVPMAGNVIAFRRFVPGGSIFGEEWVGLHYVRLFLSDPTFWSVFTNTLVLGALTLVVLFPLPIVLALLLNEVGTRPLKRLVQSISYLPHFLSIVVVAAIIMQFLSVDGTVNQILRAFGHEPTPFLQRPEWFRSIYVTSEVWQTLGWGTIGGGSGWGSLQQP